MISRMKPSRPAQRLVLLLAMLPMTGCLEAKNYLRRQVGLKELAAGPESIDTRLKELSQPELVELVVRDLIGEGNVLQKSRPDSTEAPVFTASSPLNYEDRLFLNEKVIRPLKLEGPETGRALEKARCEWDLRRWGKTWSKSVGEAIDEKECYAQFGKSEILVQPALKYAFAALLLQNHPKKDELLSAVGLHIAETEGAPSTTLCFSNKASGAMNPSCAPWETRWDMSEKEWVGQTAALAFTSRPPEEYTLAELEDAAFYLKRVAPSSTVTARAQQLLQKVEALRQPRAERRRAAIASRRARNPKLVPVEDLDTSEKTYLWHELCSEPVPDRRFENNVWVESEMICVTEFRETDTECYATTLDYRKLKGTTHWRWFGTGSSKRVACP
jgi:hypothetical protein